MKAAEESIPKSGLGKKPEVPWWSTEMQETLNEKHKTSNLMIKTKKKLNKLLEKINHTNEEMIKIIQLTTELKVIRPQLNQIAAKFKRKLYTSVLLVIVCTFVNFSKSEYKLVKFIINYGT